MRCSMSKIYDIAIIGAGPAGIATACEAVILGVEEVVLFEKSANHSDTIRKYFKDNKPVDKDWKGIEVTLQGNIDFDGGTKESTLNLFDDALEKYLIDAKFHTEVSSISKTNELFEIVTNTNETFSAKNMIVAIGKMGKPNKPDYKLPKSLSKVINFNILECKGNEKVLVVGGGDSAVEFAYYIYNDNSVTLNYRKETLTRPNPKNINNMMQKVDEGKITLKLGVDITSVEDAEGKVKVTYDDGSVHTYDRVIYGLGGSTPKEFLKNTNIVLDEKGNPLVDHTNLNAPGVYIAGDMAGHLGGSIASALNHGHIIINDILLNHCNLDDDLCRS
ncbi:MAG: Thioredoxin reductase (EC [uncultured Sulfurovum sp.]|uniref:Thioredoxin reductase (EC) n=1 Tax=uncultured Sulfurovum sp. TaxID=269237 RepID=A0A6S6SJE7_9BACT|nr:MAG: Thioredoxin reductase (EC [uncultured Sulfurovum sp.]